MKTITATELRAFYTGLILSDGSIDKGVRNRAMTLKTINEDFAQYIIDFTRMYTNFPNKSVYKPARISPDGVNHKEHWAVSIGACPYFAKLYHYFYNDYRIKRLTPQCVSWLNTTQAWANFYMSDGYVCNVGKNSGFIRDCRVDFCTDNFTEEETIKLAKQFSNFFNAKTTIVRRKKNDMTMFRFRVSVYDAQDFLVNIDPYVVPSMKYKLIMGYSKPRKWFTKEYCLLLNRYNSAHPLNIKSEDIVHTTRNSG